MLSSHYPINQGTIDRTPSSTASSSFFRRTMRASDHYGEDSHDSASDQDELVGSTDMDDDDLSDTEEIQFTYCNNNSSGNIHPGDSSQDNELCPGPNDCCCASSNDNNNKNHALDNPESASDPNTTPCERHSTSRLRIHLCCWASAVAVSAFALLIWCPLYLQQLSDTSTALFDRPLNAYGALLSVLMLVTIGFFMATLSLRYFRNWDDVLVTVVPLPWKRLISIAFVCGVSSTIIVICSYHRVACHLQDPLKGFLLAFAVVFYFMFCKKVMGLQKIFSATTSVVGLFISVDYGLCDAYRCRGVEVPLTMANIAPPTIGWQSKAVWTIVYIGGLALWTLLFSILEGDVVTSYESNHRVVHQNRLLATVSRMVSIAHDEQTSKAATSKVTKKKPKALLVAAWIHLIAFAFAVPCGLIDVIPGSGPVKPWEEFWPSTMQTVLSHLNLKHQLYNDRHEKIMFHQQKTLDFLSNLTPGSHRYNETVQMLRRSRRQVTPYDPISPSSASKQHRRLNESLHETVVNGTVHLNLLSHLTHSNKHHSAVHHPAPSIETNETTTVRKINTDKSSRSKLLHHDTNHNNNVKHKHRSVHNFTSGNSAVHNQTPIKVSHLVLNNISSHDEDVSLWPIVRGSLVLSFIYVVFIGCAFHFLFETESAVFTVAVISLALPLGGIFWSFFKLTTIADVATIVWAPEVTGELICSLLGTPIVLLGLCLFGLAHLNDAVHRQRMYTSLAS